MHFFMNDANTLVIVQLIPSSLKYWPRCTIKKNPAALPYIQDTQGDILILPTNPPCICESLFSPYNHLVRHVHRPACGSSHKKMGYTKLTCALQSPVSTAFRFVLFQLPGYKLCTALFLCLLKLLWESRKKNAKNPQQNTEPHYFVHSPIIAA